MSFLSNGIETLLTQIQGKKEMCLNCMDRTKAKGYSAVQYKNPNPANLRCGCNADLARLDFWLFKTTAGVEGVPTRKPGAKKEAGVPKKATMVIHENALMLVRAGIQEISGLTTRGLFRRIEQRLAETAIWALTRLKNQLSKFPEHAAMAASLETNLKALEKTLAPINNTWVQNTWDPLDPQDGLHPENRKTAMVPHGRKVNRPEDEDGEGEEEQEDEDEVEVEDD